MHSTVWKALHNFKIKRAQEARHYQFFFQNLQNYEIFEIFEMFKSNSWINVYYKTVLVVLRLLVLFSTGINFLGKFVAKTQNYQIKLKFCTKTNSKMQSSIVMFIFLFSTGNTFLGKSGLKNHNFQSELKFCTRLIWICRIM